MELKLIIDRFEGDKAVILSPDGANFVWPADKLPAGAREGSALFLEIELDEETAANKKREARELLNELLSDGKE